MASGSLNTEGEKKIRVMSLDYIKSSIAGKTSTKTVCICSKDAGLNLDDEVAEPATDLDCITVNVDCKTELCKHCGRTTRKPKPSFFKFLRKRLWRKDNNIGTESINNKCSNNKVVSDTTSCAFMPNEFKPKDNDANCNGTVEKSYCDVTASEVINNSTKYQLNSEVCNESVGVNSKLSSDNEFRPNTFDASGIMVGKSSEEETFSAESSCTTSNGNFDSKEIESSSQSSELVPLPSPKTRSLTCELLKLSKYGWYWGPISREEAEEKLQDQPDGAFLVRDSSADHYLLSLSFRSSGKLLHTRIEHSQGLFSFYHQPEQEGFATIGELIDHSVSFSQSAVFCYSRPRSPGHPAFPVRLTKPVSRFTQVRSLQYLCRFVIRQYIRVDNIENLPLPNRIKGYIQEGHY